MAKMYKTEGLRAFWKGILPPIIVETPKRAVKVSVCRLELNRIEIFFICKNCICIYIYTYIFFLVFYV